MTNRKCEESDGVRKVRLKTTSGVLTLCYRGLQSSREANNSPNASSAEKVSQGGSQVSGVSKESGFESLPELFQFSDQLSAAEVSNGYSNSLLDLTPDFSTYNFWASESGRNLPYAVDLSDTFSRCDLAGMIDYAAPGLEPIVDDAHGPEALQNCATKPDPHFQNTVNSSPMIGEMNTVNRESHWDLPLQLEENFLESASYWNLLKGAERDIDGASVVDDFLVDRSPEFCGDAADVENLDSNLLVYAPNRYLEDACIFQSPPVESESDVETLTTIPGDSIHDPQEGSRRKRGSVREECLKNGQSMDTKSRNSDTTAIAQFRSPKVSRKKVRTFRRRPLQGSPTSAKKLHLYGKFIYEGSSQVVQRTPSPEREGQSETKSAERKRRRRLPLRASSVDILQGWLHENLSDPYPSRQEKEDLVYQTGLKISQIDNWLGNARQKLKLKSRAVKDLCGELTSSQEQPEKQSKRKCSYSLKRL